MEKIYSIMNGEKENRGENEKGTRQLKMLERIGNEKKERDKEITNGKEKIQM